MRYESVSESDSSFQNIVSVFKAYVERNDLSNAHSSTFQGVQAVNVRRVEDETTARLPFVVLAVPGVETSPARWLLAPGMRFGCDRAHPSHSS